MELEAAKMIGAGLAVIGLSGVGIGIGNIFSSLIAAIARNPASEKAVFPKAMLGFALCLVWALLLALFPWLAFKSFRASRRPDAWLVRWSPEGLYLRFRSRQNWRFPEDTPSVVSLARREIDWIGESSASLDAPDEHGHWTRRLRTRSLAIGLKRVDSGPLIAALRAERQRRDHRGVRTNDEPVTIGKDGILLVQLRRTEELIEQLSTHYPTSLATHDEGRDFEAMSADEREDHILALAQAGQTIAAVKAARQVYGCGLTEAKRLVAELTAR